MQSFTKISTEILAESPLYQEVPSPRQTTCYTSIGHYLIMTQSFWVSISTTHISTTTISQTSI